MYVQMSDSNPFYFVSALSPKTLGLAGNVYGFLGDVALEWAWGGRVLGEI